MKPTDDYVRGYKDAKLMMDETLKKTIDHIKSLENDLDELYHAYIDVHPFRDKEEQW